MTARSVFIFRAVGNENAARDVIQDFAVRHLADPRTEPAFDETGQDRKGAATAGAGRQYTGTTGQVSSAIVAA